MRSPWYYLLYSIYICIYTIYTYNTCKVMNGVYKNMHIVQKSLWVALLLVVMGCGRHGSDFLGAAEPEQVAHPFLITVPDAIALLAADSVVFIDGRKRDTYSLGHISGAVALSWDADDLYTMPIRGNEVALDDLRTLLATTYGIDNSKTYVIYGGSADDWGAEGRVVWLFDLVGITRYKVLHGGYGAWLDATQRGVTNRSTLPVITAPVWGHAFNNYASTRSVQNAFTDTLIQFVDTRAANEWSGSFNYNSLSVTKGHIPGAIHVDFAQLYQIYAPGYLRPPHEIIAQCRAAGVDTSRPIIAYCTGGVRSAFAYFAFKIAYGAGVKNYDASYEEWGAKAAHRPVASVVADTSGMAVLDIRISYQQFMAHPQTYVTTQGLHDSSLVVAVIAGTPQQERHAVRQLAALGYTQLRIMRK